MVMTPRQRIEAAIAIREPDRVPLFPMPSAWTACLVGATPKQHYTDPEVMVAAQMAAYERLRWDSLMCTGGPAGRIHAFRPESVFQEENDDPQVHTPVVQDATDLDRLTVPSFEDDLYTGTEIKAIRRLRSMLGPDVPIWASVDSPWQLACNLRGVQQSMMDTLDRPELVDELLVFAYEAMAEFARQVIAAGGDLYLVDALASPNLISPATYRRWPEVYERKMADLAHGLGVRQMLHICGDTSHILEDMADTGSDIVDLDGVVSMEAAKERVGRRVCLKGNINPISLLRGTPEEVEEECWAAIRAAASEGGFILSTGCQIPRDAPLENVYAMTRAVERYGVYAREQR